MQKAEKSHNAVRNAGIGHLISFLASALPKGEYQVRIVNATGQPVQTGTMNHPGGNLTQVVPLPPAIKAGIYSLQILNTQTTLTRTFIIQ